MLSMKWTTPLVAMTSDSGTLTVLTCMELFACGRQSCHEEEKPQNTEDVMEHALRVWVVQRFLFCLVSLCTLNVQVKFKIAFHHRYDLSEPIVTG